MPIAIPEPWTAGRGRLPSVETSRRAALERLYERRSALDDLINALEKYQEATAGPKCAEISAAAKWSSGSARSRT